MGLPPPTRWSIQRTNGKCKDHRVGQLTKMTVYTISCLNQWANINGCTEIMTSTITDGGHQNWWDFLPPPYHPPPLLPDAGGGMVSWGHSAELIPCHALPWPVRSRWCSSLSRLGCRRRQLAARSSRRTLSALLFEQSCVECVSEEMCDCIGNHCLS